MPILNWDDLRLFVTICRHGRLLAASKALGLDQSTIARRLTALETAMGTRLANRSPRGIALTEAGQALLAHAERMEAEVLAAAIRLGEHQQILSGVVRLATPEAFGTFLVAPNAWRLHRRHPGLQLELVPESRAVSLSKREADIVISLNRPPKGRVIVRKLTDYRLGLFASRTYIEAHPSIDSVEAAQNHPFVWFIDEMIEIPELRYLNQIAADVPTVFRSSSIAAQHEAVANGLGLGILHNFAAGQDPRLVRVLEQQIEICRGYWMMLHPDSRSLPRIRAVLEFLDEIVTINRAII